MVYGIDIGGTKIVGVALGSGLRIEASAQLPTPAHEGAQAILATVREVIDMVRAKVPHTVGRIPVGIGTAGIVQPGTGNILSATSSLSAWAGTNIATELLTYGNIAATVMNDVQALAVAERHSGAIRTGETAIIVAVGTGIGGAIMCHDHLVSGRFGAAGHLGHVPSVGAVGMRCPCGAFGHVEAVSSGPAIVAQAIAQGLTVTTLPDVAALAQKDSTEGLHAQKIMYDSGRFLGQALGGIINTFAPDRVILAGGVFKSGPGYLQGIRDGVLEVLLPILIDTTMEMSSLGDYGVACGAALVSRESLSQEGVIL